MRNTSLASDLLIKPADKSKHTRNDYQTVDVVEIIKPILKL